MLEDIKIIKEKMLYKNGKPIKKNIYERSKTIVHKTYHKPHNINGINQIIGQKMSLEQIDNAIEDHIIIHPNIEWLTDNELIEAFRKCIIRFYRKELGQYFNKKKDKQMPFVLSIEYGYTFPYEKKTHLHIIMQAIDEEMLLRFHESVEKELKIIFPKLVYFVKRIDSSEYRKNVYNYITKENRSVFGKNDLCYKKTIY